MANPTITFIADSAGLTFNDPSLFDLRITASPDDPTDYALGRVDGWCIDISTDLPVRATYTGVIYSSYEYNILIANPHFATLGDAHAPVLASVPTDNTYVGHPYIANLDLINWLINNIQVSGSTYIAHVEMSNAANQFQDIVVHYYTLTGHPGELFTYGDVQQAMYELLGDGLLVNSNYLGPYSISNVTTMVNEAVTHDGFVPLAGQKLAVVVDAGTNQAGTIDRQPLIITTQAAALGDYVWNDANHNGIQDAGETGINGATVNLVRDLNNDHTIEANEVLATTTTADNPHVAGQHGYYEFDGLTPGLDYQVQFVMPAGYDTVSPLHAGNNSATDSDALVSNVVDLSAGQFNSTIDAGFYQSVSVQPAALGDFVWSDTNANGIQDAGEAGISGVTVNLLDSTGANVLGTTTTDANGLYHFTNLNPGSYEVQFVAPAGYAVSPQDQGADDAVDSDANAATGKTIAYTLISGQTDNTIDAGLYQKAALGDFVWADTNANGIQDAGEAGIAGVTVNLLDSTGANVLGTTTTDANGLYHFTNLNPGSYEVQFVAPAGYSVSAKDQGANDAVDSDADTVTGKTIAYTLISGQTDNTIDAGLYQKAALGDFVWSDTNANGIQDAGEAGIAGVTVNLLDSTGANVLGTTTTDANGLYHFTNLNPGSYEVQFVAPAGYTVSPQDQGANDAVDSDADTVTGKTIAYTLISGQTNNTVDAGLYQKAALGDFVWADTNANGIQDAGEAGISGVTVNLLDSTGANVLGTTTTDANGLYHFTNLNPGSYEVQFVAPAGYTVSPQDQGANDAVNSDANAATGKTIAYTLVSGQTDNTIDAGLYQKAALGDFVWSDTNANGIQDAGEAGISGVTVNLLDSTGANVLGTTTTDADGLYHFTNLNPGSYEVQFVAPAGYSVSAKDQGANDAVDSDADTVTGKTIAYTLISGQTDNTIDAGLYQKAALGDFVWSDTNANGIQDAGEAGIAGVTVNLLDSTGANVLGTTTTDANGLYHFTNLNPGSYEVQFVAPAGYTVSPQDQGANDAVDSDADTVTGKTIAYTLISGQTNNTVDAGLYQKAALGDFVWADTNANGIQDAGEAGISGVTVNLLDSTGANVLGTTTTDANGLYHFTNLNPGSYEVQFVAPAGYTVSPQDQGANDAVDSDANAATGKTIAYTLVSGQTDNTIDAGLYQKAALGDFVWSDTNANGIQDAGEAGISGVTVNLLDSTGANVLGTTTTDADGLYHFTNLNPGSYEVQFVAPAGYAVSPQDQGANDAVDSDANAATGKTIAYTLISGQTDNTIDAGLYQKAALGDFVWSDTNANGIQDAGEAGIAGVAVNLLDSTGANVLGTTTTDANGLYHFTNLNPGSYEVQFVAPAGYSVSAKDQGANDAVDSDADTVTGKTIAYTLISGQTDNTVDAGLYQKAALGDFVWADTNANGIQDAGEAGISSVTVNLLDSTGANVLGTTTTDANGLYHFTNLNPGSYEVQFVAPAGYSISAKDQGANDAVDSDADMVTGKTIAYTLTSGQTNNTVDAGLYQKAALGDFVWSDTNANGIQDAGENGISGVTVNLLDSTGTTTLATTTTDANGLYHFTNLNPGSYEVQFVAPAGYTVSPQDQGANDAVDSDANAATGKTIAYTLISGQTNNTVDAGLYQKAALGDFVWNDSNANGVQDAGENGISGVTVKLLDSTGTTVLNTTTTDANGLYHFTNLNPGSYEVQFVAPAGYAISPQDQGANDAVDSDANAATGKTIAYTLTSGQTNNTIDAGLYQKAALGDFVWSDTNANGIQDAGENGISGVTVNLLDSAGTTTLATTTTDANGLYHFTNLNPGSYEVQFVAPAGYTVSPQDQGANDAVDSDANAATGKTIAYTLVSGQANNTVDAGLYQKAAIGDFVWNDTNANGVQDAGENGISGVTVKLLDSTGTTVLNTTTTDANGLYHFTNLNPGSYEVQFVAPAGYAISPQDQGANDAVDSDANAATGKTIAYMLTSGQTNNTVDAGLYSTSKGSIGDKVFCDANSNGIQDAGEGVVAGVTVNLLGAGADKIFGTADDAVLATTTTDANGAYSFAGLSAGQYQVQFVAPAGHSLSPQDQGANDSIDSDANVATGKTGVINLAAGQNIATVDAGVLPISATFNFSGNSATSGAAGNIRSFSANGINVHASAFSSDQTTGAFSSAYLGSFSGGLGVTDPTESGANNTHTIDNVGGQNNYVVFEFDQTIVLDKAFLGYVVGDSDLQVWIGNFAGAYNNHLSLSAAILSSMGFTEENTTTLATTRTADLNANGYAGNVVVIAADTLDATPEDYFKVQTMDLTSYACSLQLMAQLGDRVWLDSNQNGQQDAGENGVAGVTVKLIGAGGDNAFGTPDDTVLASTTTDANGGYAFTSLNPGSYQVQFVAPAGYAFTGANIGNDTSDSDANTVTGKSQVVTLAASQTDNTIDAGLYSTAKGSIGDKVFCDANSNGIQDAGEGVVAGATVNLIGAGADKTFGTADDAVLATTTTDANGAYSFAGLSAGQYQVQFVAPAGHSLSPQDQGANDSIDSDANAATGKTGVINLAAGQNIATVDAGVLPISATFNFSGNSATTGADGNIRSYSANGINVHVSAFSSSQTTGAFSSAYLGSYAGGLGVTDDSESGANNTHTIDNAGGQNNYVVFEFDQSIVIDKAFLGYVAGDSDLQLWIGNFAGAYNNHLSLNAADLSAMGFTEENTSALSTTRTADLNANGYAGNVIVIAADTLNANLNDYFKIQTMDLTSYACSLQLMAQIGDRVWLDSNQNGQQDAGENGVAGVTVKLIGAGGDNAFGTPDDTVLATTTTDANGGYAFTNLNPGSYQVQFVAPAGYALTGANIGNDTSDSDADTVTGKSQVVTLAAGQADNTIDAGLYQKAALGDFVWNDANGNGIQDAGENGISGVTVKLLDSTGTNVLATTTTDANGLYHFTNLNAGSYEVQFVAPAGYTISAQDQGANNAVDSDANVATGKTQVVTLVSGQTDNTIDAGLYQKAALGDFVWKDANANGIQDAGESGISGVTVKLLDGTGTNVLGTTTTDANGLYHFTNLNPGSYEVQFVAPAGYAISAQDQGANNAVDSDANVASGKTQVVTLVSGQTDNTIDAGLYQKAALGDFVWNDANANGIQDAGESGISGVTVKLLDGTGTNVLGTTTTDANGLYHFTNLTPGSYEVQFVAPAGYSISAKDQGANDAVDSDADTVTGKTIAYTLTSGQTNNTVDAGLNHGPPITPDVFDGTIGFWKTHQEAWNGSAADNSAVSNLVKSGVLTKADVLPVGVDSNGDGKINSSDIGVLIGDANGNGKTDAGETTLFIPLAAAQLFIDPSASGNDPRAILLRQAIAAQLNIDNGHGEPNDLVGEAAAWLRGMAPFTYSDGSSGKIDTNGNKVLDAAEFTISNGNISFTSAAQNSSKQLWMQDVDVYGGAVGDWDNDPLTAGNQEANGQDLKNALQSFNMGQLVTSTNGSFVGLSDGTSLSFTHTNTTDSFWLTLHDGGLI